jgi:hypothetical protein
MMNPLAIAAKGKGMRGAVKRAVTIQQRYGVTPAKMDGLLAKFARVLNEHGACATFPITTVVLLRNRGVIEKYQSRSIEFAVHGFYHVDQTSLGFEEQKTQYGRARELFHDRGISCSGFRSPYLRCGPETLRAIQSAGYLYDSSQGLVWDVADEMETPTYRHVLSFYDTVPAAAYPALPRADLDLIRIPYCLPDDEALVERFELEDAQAMMQIWQKLLLRTHALGELCTIGLHPERIPQCERALAETLKLAEQLSPRVWFARLDEIARWWQERANTLVTTESHPADELSVRVDGPPGTTLLARNLILLTPSTSWNGVYRRVPGSDVSIRTWRRPFIAVSHRSAPYLTSFLRQQGYIVETAEDEGSHSFHLDRPNFTYQDERALLDEIEQGTFSLLRLARWYDGAQSALCVTGDIDALTVWDYSMRLFGR